MMMLTLKKFKKRYVLKDGGINWHRLYFDSVPAWMTKYSPPGGDYNYAAYLYQPYKYIIALYDNVKYFIQRGYRGYSDRDVWSIDYYLNSWLPPALAHLKRTTYGCPIGMTKQQWNAKLDRMIRAFETAKKIEDFTYLKPDEYKNALKQFRSDFDVFKNYYFSLWN